MKTAATLALDATGGARWIWMARFGLVAALALTLVGGCGSSGSTEKDSSSSADLGGSGDTAAGVDALEGSDVFANDLVALDLTIGDLSGSGDGVEEADLGSDGVTGHLHAHGCEHVGEGCVPL